MKAKQMRGVFRYVFFAVSLFLFLSLSGCRTSGETASMRLYRMQETKLLPHGCVFDSEAEKWEEGYISAETAENLYRFDGVSELHHAERYAVFVSDRFGSVCEVGIFDAPDRASANELVLMCRRRIALLSRYAENADTGRLFVYGNTVVYVVGLDEKSTNALLSAAF